MMKIEVALIVVPGIYLRHGPEAQSVFITFASAFLIKVGLVIGLSDVLGDNME